MRRRAFALAAALIRIARAGQGIAPELAAALRRSAIEITVAVEDSDSEHNAILVRAVRTSIALSRLAVEEGILSYFDCNTITSAGESFLKFLDKTAEVLQGEAGLQLQDLFSADLQKIKVAAKSGNVEMQEKEEASPLQHVQEGQGEDTEAQQEGLASYGESLAGENKSATAANAAKAEMRQSILLQHIRRSTRPAAAGAGEQEGCRFRDLQEFFPEVSERTLRYDLEKLVRAGLVERLRHGRGGTYYRPVQRGAAAEAEEM